MKCQACGYEKRSKVVTTHEVVRYKQGKRKGEIKEVKEHVYDVFENDPEFKEIFLRKDVDDFVVKDSDWMAMLDTVELYACPMCNTVQMKERLI